MSVGVIETFSLGVNMFGNLIGKIISAPIRIVNLPLKALDRVTRVEPRFRPTAISTTLEDAAKIVEKSTKYVCGEGK